ncbi:putative membrane protein [Thiogranum longum]|uniref:Protoporphyrinogen IX oxidase n=1 Tax=Thiogranum longum TaxID=1537524 RepID=A0A4R1HF30_9GAMM|nr:CopD family protein [Thiogranum longum]TCK19263.1 putative membrane protein [Thiogranum longum]
MLWIKAFHIIFMVTWFAGLFYLPRLFVYHADCQDQVGHERFVIMERKLLAIMTLGAILAAFFGFWLLAGWHWPLVEHWLQLKLVLVAALILYHFQCTRIVTQFRLGKNSHSGIFYRWFNEIPALLLVAIVLLAVIRPA